jgi:hypothetical protein
MSRKGTRKGEEPSIIGWRCWLLTPFGGLMSHAGWLDTRWTPGMMTSVCREKYIDTPELMGPHTPPGEKCTCGIRVLDSCASMLDGIIAHPQRMNCSEKYWAGLVAANECLAGVYEFRKKHDALWIPDVIGNVYGYGRVEPGNKLGDVPGFQPDQYVDPIGTVRVERAEIGDRLYLAPHLTRTSELQELGYRFRSAVGSLKRCYPKVKVHIGTEHGRAWIDQIAESEGVPSTWKDSPRARRMPFPPFASAKERRQVRLSP